MRGGHIDHITPILRQLHFGCQSYDEWSSRLPAWYTKCHQAKYLRISADDIHLAAESSARSRRSFSGKEVLYYSCSDVLLQLDHVSATTYLPVCETRKSGA